MPARKRGGVDTPRGHAMRGAAAAMRAEEGGGGEGDLDGGLGDDGDAGRVSEEEGHVADQVALPALRHLLARALLAQRDRAFLDVDGAVGRLALLDERGARGEFDGSAAADEKVLAELSLVILVAPQVGSPLARLRAPARTARWPAPLRALPRAPGAGRQNTFCAAFCSAFVWEGWLVWPPPPPPYCAAAVTREQLWGAWPRAAAGRASGCACNARGEADIRSLFLGALAPHERTEREALGASAPCERLEARTRRGDEGNESSPHRKRELCAAGQTKRDALAPHPSYRRRPSPRRAAHVSTPSDET